MIIISYSRENTAIDISFRASLVENKYIVIFYDYVSREKISTSDSM